MTNQQGAPEALRCAEWLEHIAAGRDVVDIAHLAATSAAELRRLHALTERQQQELIQESHRTAEQKLRADQMTRQHADQAAMNREARAQLAALVEAQQPAAHVQNPAEIEHVACDVSKNGAELNMLYAELPDPVWRTLAGVAFSEKQLRTFTDATHALRTQQPAPAGDESKPHGWLYDWTHSSATGKPDTTYTGFTKDEAHARKHDNCIAVFTTPQADSQPAPDVDLPTGAIINGRALAERLENGYDFECEAGPLRMCSDWQEFVRCFDYLATWVENRAARAPADSVLEDAARLWDAFVEAWRNELGVDKIVNIMGGADKLKAVFLDAARKQGGAT